MTELPDPDRPPVECDLPDGRTVLGGTRGETAALWEELNGNPSYRRAAAGLGPGDAILDVGAHIGLASLCFTAQAPGARLLAFEPAPRTYACLAGNLRRHVPGGAAFNVAVGAEPGTAELVYYPFLASMSTLHADPDEDLRNLELSFANTGLREQARTLTRRALTVTQRVRVEVTTVSAVLAAHAVARVGLIKIDVERGEDAVLRGIDAGSWPLIGRVLVEVHDLDGRLDAILARLTDLGFSVAVTQAPELVGGSVYDVLATRD